MTTSPVGVPRYALAWLVSPFPGAFLQAMVVAFWPKPGQGVFEHPGSMFAAICILIWALELVFGLPLLLLLRRRGLASWRAYAMTGTISVAAPLAPVILWTFARGSVSLYALVYDLAFLALAGFLAGAAFWTLTRPDRHLA